MARAGPKLIAAHACGSVLQENTPLHYAAGYGRVEVCKVLLELGANTKAKNETGKTALDLVQ